MRRNDRLIANHIRKAGLEPDDYDLEQVRANAAQRYEGGESPALAIARALGQDAPSLCR